MLAYAQTMLGQHSAMYAEDVVQEASLAAYNNLSNFDESKGSIGAWLRTIIRNRAIDKLRQAKARSYLDIDEFVQGVEEVYAMFDQQSMRSNWGDRVDILWECVNELKKPMQVVVRLFYINGFSLKEISAKVSASEMTVGQRLKRSRDLIRLCAERKLRAEAS